MKDFRKTHLYRAAVIIAAALVFLTAAAAAEMGPWGPPGWPGGNSYPDGNAQPGGYSGPFGNDIQPDGFGQQQSPFSAEKTELKAFPSVRSVKAGEELTVDFDLLLSQEDAERVSIIEQGTDLEYTLVYSKIDDENDRTEVPGGSVHFSMNRTENEKCSLTLTPQVGTTSVLTVQAKMIFSDGETQECTSDRILVYTEPEIRSHLSAQACVSGEQLQADFMIIGPEGNWQFTCYPAVSLDNGNTYTRSSEPVGTFTVNTHEQEPQMKIQVAVTADENCMYRLETVVIQPDGQTREHNSDPVRVSITNAV